MGIYSFLKFQLKFCKFFIALFVFLLGTSLVAQLVKNPLQCRILRFDPWNGKISGKGTGSHKKCVCVCLCVCVCVCVCTHVHTHRLQPVRLLCPWDSPGKNTGMGCHAFFQRIFLTQGLKLSLLHWQVGSLLLALAGLNDYFIGIPIKSHYQPGLLECKSSKSRNT